MELQDFVMNKDYESIYILGRYFYKIGEPIYDDKFYDALERKLRAERDERPGIADYLDRTYDDDPVPVELLKKLGIQPAYTVRNPEHNELFRYLEEEKSDSIHSVINYEEAFDYFRFLKIAELDFMASLKTDGVNTKMLYKNSEFALSLSRGRKGECFDFTDKSARIMPQYLPNEQEYLKVTGESYVLKEALPKLRKIYNEDKYKTCKSAALSMLRVAHEREHYKYLKTIVFAADGLDTTLQGTFDKLEKAGLTTVPHKLFSWRDIPDTRESFDRWLKQEVLDYIWSISKDIPSDGVVIEVNDLNYTGVQKNQYNSRQLALKFEQWNYKYSCGVIRDILIEQKRVYKSVRVVIEPIVTYDGCTAEYINSFNPSILINNDLYIGKKVYFEKNSGAVNILLHGDKLQKVLEEAGDIDGG